MHSNCIVVLIIPTETWNGNCLKVEPFIFYYLALPSIWYCEASKIVFLFSSLVISSNNSSFLLTESFMIKVCKQIVICTGCLYQ